MNVCIPMTDYLGIMIPPEYTDVNRQFLRKRKKNQPRPCEFCIPRKRKNSWKFGKIPERAGFSKKSHPICRDPVRGKAGRINIRCGENIQRAAPRNCVCESPAVFLPHFFSLKNLPKRKFPGRHRRVKICLPPGAQVLAHRKIHVCGLFALLYQTFRFFGNIPINAAWAAILAAHGLLKNHVIAHSSTHCSVLRAGFAGGAFTLRPLLPPDVERGERSSPASSDSGSKRGTGIHPP